MGTPNKNGTERKTVPLRVEHAAATGDTTVPLFKARKRTLIERVDYVSAGLAADAANQFAISVKNGSTVVADGISNVSPAAIAAGISTLTNGSKANRTLAAGDTLNGLLDETGAANLPAGAFIVWLTELN